MTEDRVVPAAPGEAQREFHAVADLFPLLRGAAFDELAADIKKNGLREPILVDDEGRILDGRNRYRACLAAGVEPHFVPWDGRGALADVALSLNLKRRHLGESQRAMVAARLAKMFAEEAARRKGQRRMRDPANLQGAPLGEPRERAAAMANVSPRLISSAIRVLRDGCEDLVAAVESGQLAVSTAYNLVGLPPEEQAKVLAGGAAEIARKVRALRGGSPPRPGGQFSVIRPSVTGAELRDLVGEDAVVLLCLGSSRLPDAIQALEARGFRCTRST